MTGRTARRRVLRVRIPAGPGEDARADLLAVEEPLEIRVGGEPLAVTMRTPGDDIDLAAGFLAGEGVIASASDVTSIKKWYDNGGRRHAGCRGHPARCSAAPELHHEQRVWRLRQGQHRRDPR